MRKHLRVKLQKISANSARKKLCFVQYIPHGAFTPRLKNVITMLQQKLRKFVGISTHRELSTKVETLL
jgi:hypothetical protein